MLFSADLALFRKVRSVVFIVFHGGLFRHGLLSFLLLYRILLSGLRSDRQSII